jgi:hypothetical protein
LKAIAFDVGGTFVDFVLYDSAGGKTWVLKISSSWSRSPRPPRTTSISGARSRVRPFLDAVDVWAEGLQFLGLKIRDEGLDNRALWKLIENNVRVPRLVIGDMRAQVAAAEMGAQRLTGLMDEVGRERVFAAQHWLEDYSERMLRHEIAQLPDGDYTAEGLVDGFPDDPSPRNRNLRLVVTLRVRGDELEIDLTGTAPQLDNLPLNMPLEGTVTSCVLTSYGRSSLTRRRMRRCRRTAASFGRSGSPPPPGRW